MNIFLRFQRLLDNTKLKQKLLISYILFLVLPLITYTYLFYSKASETLRYQTFVSADQVFGQTVSGLNYQTHNMVNALNLITMNQTINRILSKPDYSNWSSQLSDYRIIKDFLSGLEKTQEGTRVQIFFNDNFESTADNVHTTTLNKIRETTWYKQLQQSHTSEMWFVRETEGKVYLSVGRMIWNLSNLVQNVGVVTVDIPISSINALLSKALIDSNEQIYIVDGNNEIMVGSGSELLDSAQLSNLLASRVSSREYMIHQRAIAATDLELISFIPMKGVLQNITNLRNQMLVILISISVLGYLVALYVANLSTDRIVKLIRNMRRVQQGEFSTYIHPHGQDEIGDLIRNFNFMTSRIKQLVDDEFESGKALKNAELRTLQSQINPHFLYNSLDVINIMAIERESPDISRMVKSLTKFYKLGLNRGKDLVTIRDETEHIKAYVDIQNIRYEDGIDLILDIPESLMDCTILKLTLQPLVENAILHGILEKREKTGVVRISGERVADSVIVTVSDDGVGMREDSLSEHRRAEENDSLHGFGIRNVHERLRLSFGDLYGIRFESERNEGTQAFITIPYTNETSSPE